MDASKFINYKDNFLIKANFLQLSGKNTQTRSRGQELTLTLKLLTLFLLSYLGQDSSPRAYT